MSNKVNFSSQVRFPLAIETMEFLQTMIKHNSTLAYIGGENYILYGCNEVGLNVSSGYVVINGELLPFSGGVKQTNIYIKETKRSVIASGYNFPDVYISRSVEFGISENPIRWDSLKRITTNIGLQKLIDDLEKKVDELQGIPKGVIVMWSGEIKDIPEGWALCTGQFGTPNLQGRFVVGHHLDDDDYAMRKEGGAKQVTLTIDQIPSHAHGYQGFNSRTGNHGDDNRWTIADTVAGKNTDYVGGGQAHENRPPYYTLAYIMKL